MSLFPQTPATLMRNLLINRWRQLQLQTRTLATATATEPWDSCFPQMPNMGFRLASTP